MSFVFVFERGIGLTDKYETKFGTTSLLLNENVFLLCTLTVKCTILNFQRPPTNLAITSIQNSDFTIIFSKTFYTDLKNKTTELSEGVV